MHNPNHPAYVGPNPNKGAINANNANIHNPNHPSYVGKKGKKGGEQGVGAHEGGSVLAWHEGEDASKAWERKNRFKDHLGGGGGGGKHKNGGMNKWNAWDGDDSSDSDDDLMDQEAIVGELDVMCAPKEIQDRESTHQMDRFELKVDSDPIIPK